MRETIRTYEIISESEDKDFPRAQGIKTPKGVACSLGSDGTVKPFQSGSEFIGFVVGNVETRSAIRTRGSVVLYIPGATNDDRGKPVYCTGPDAFTLDKKAKGAKIGAIRFCQRPDRPTVFFQRETDDRPLNLEVAYR